MRRIVLALFAMVGVATATLADDSSNGEIDGLLQAVADSGCVFIRNGKEYDGPAAVNHLAMKRKRGTKYFTTAEEFIERLASSSSWSGKPYAIRCAAVTRPAIDWFTDALQAYRASLASTD